MKQIVIWLQVQLVRHLLFGLLLRFSLFARLRLLLEQPQQLHFDLGLPVLLFNLSNFD
jgi:hypothetical protein